MALISPVALSMATSAPSVPESCSRLTFAFSVGIEREHFEVDDVARVENVGQLELGPGDIGLRQRGGAPSEMHLGSAR
jgi:hypothetical protein